MTDTPKQPKIHIAHNHMGRDFVLPAYKEMRDLFGPDITVAFTVDGDTIKYAKTQVHSKDQFCYKTGRELATQRLQEYLATGEQTEFTDTVTFKDINLSLDIGAYVHVQGLVRAFVDKLPQLTPEDISIREIKQRLIDHIRSTDNLETF